MIPATTGLPTTRRRLRVPVSTHELPEHAPWPVLLSSPPSLSPGPPSAPVNVISSVNGTSVHLEWDRPPDAGGRSDLQYSVVCQKCSGEGGPCENCDSHPGGASGGKAGASVAAASGGTVERSGTVAIRYIPRQSGLTEAWVTVLNLVAHSNYSFRIRATNAVTLQSNEPSLYAIANITTNQAGRAPERTRIHTVAFPVVLRIFSSSIRQPAGLITCLLHGNTVLMGLCCSRSTVRSVSRPPGERQPEQRDSAVA